MNVDAGNEPDESQDDPGNGGDDVNLDDVPTEAVNLVTEFAKDKKKTEWLEESSKKAKGQIVKDNKSRSDWVRQRADEIRVFAGLMKDKSTTTGGNQPRDPLLCRLVLQILARVWDQICPAKGAIIQVHETSERFKDLARRRERWMNYKVRKRIPGWVMGMYQTLVQVFISGSVFREVFYDPTIRSTRAEVVGAEDVIVHFSRTDVEPLMPRVPRVTRILHLYRWEVEELADAGVFDKKYVERVYKSPARGAAEDEGNAIEEVGREIDSVKKPERSSGEDADMDQRDFYRCHTWMRLPDEERMTPVILTLDAKSGLPVALTVRETDDPVEMARYERQAKVAKGQAELLAQKYESDMKNWLMLGQSGAPAGQQPTKPVMPPEPRKPKKKIVYQMVHYRLFPNPAGFYGIGIGFLVVNTNKMVNKLQGEYLTSARLHNSSQGILPKGTAGKRGEFSVEPGKWHESELDGEEMKNVVQIKFDPPSEGLFKFIREMKQDANTLIADVDTMSGEAGPTNETAKAASDRMFNATALLGNIGRIMTEALAEEVKIYNYHDRLFLDDVEEFFSTVTEGVPPDQAGPQKTGREDFQDEFAFTFTADQRLQSQPERLQILGSLLDRLVQIPFLQQDQPRAAQLYYAALKDMFKTLDKPEFEAALGQPPAAPAPPKPPTPMSQLDENFGFFQDKDHDVFPTDNHLEHLKALDDLEASEYFKDLSSTGKQLFDRHRRTHIGMFYKQQAQMMEAHGIGIGFPSGMERGPADGGSGAPPPGGVGAGA